MPLFVRILVPIVSIAVGAVLVALPCGCGRKGDSESTRVRGIVTFQGKPLAGGLVVFAPDPDRGGSGKPFRGTLGADGVFELRLGDDAAIPAGWYRVAIASPAAFPATDAAAPGLVFPAKLARPDLSGLVREVKAGHENIFEFAIEVPVG